MSKARQVFQVEAYWGNCDGELLHGTLSIEANSMEEALDIARSERRIPDDEGDRYPVCAKPEYFEDHYDIEPIGDEYDEIRGTENLAFVSRLLP